MSRGRPDETRRLTCELPEHELELLRKELSNEVWQLQATENEKKDLVSAMSKRIDALKSRVVALNLETETGSGIRDVELFS